MAQTAGVTGYLQVGTRTKTAVKSFVLTALIFQTLS
jgi:hypothetical protein